MALICKGERKDPTARERRDPPWAVALTMSGWPWADHSVWWGWWPWVFIQVLPALGGLQCQKQLKRNVSRTNQPEKNLTAGIQFGVLENRSPWSSSRSRCAPCSNIRCPKLSNLGLHKLQFFSAGPYVPLRLKASASECCLPVKRL